MKNDSIFKTVLVAGLLCIVCSVLVSTAAVKLRPKQTENKVLDVKKNLLLAAGLIKNRKASKSEILKAFEQIEVKLIDFETGLEVKDQDIEAYDEIKAAKDPKRNKVIKVDYAGIKTRSKYGKVYLAKENGRVNMIILPIHGKGLWSTMYGFVALRPDTNTIQGIGFYQHGETPGLGGEIENPRWKALFVGKKVYDVNWEPAFKVVKGMANSSSKTFIHEVDGLSGATLTSNGVTNTFKYWFGKEAHWNYLNNFRKLSGANL